MTMKTKCYKDLKKFVFHTPLVTNEYNPSERVELSSKLLDLHGDALISILLRLLKEVNVWPHL